MRSGAHLAWLDGQSSSELTTLAAGPAANTRSYVAAMPSTIATGTDVRAVLRAVDAERIAGDLAWPRWIGSIPYDVIFAPDAHTWMDDAPQEPTRHAARTNRSPYFARYDAVFEYAHELGQGFVVGESDACAVLERSISDALAQARSQGRTFDVTGLDGTSRIDHQRAIERVLEHIRAGNIYQANLARTWSGSFSGSALELFCAMREQSPVPFGFFQAEGGARWIACRSMERYLAVNRTDRSVESRPIKGTIRREDASSAHALSDALLQDPKERAEHAMIVDLVRSDLSRISDPATVCVESSFRPEPYRGLFHMVSTIRGRVRADVGLEELIAATFPPGSVTGCPKRRALAIIDELEPTSRDVYCGAVGYVSSQGDVSLAVAIRTAIVEQIQPTDGTVTYRAGGGIVHRSDPIREVEETETKARVFLGAIRSRPSD